MASRPHHLLYVCSGNICRSPMAEYIARHHADATNMDAIVKSAGTLGLVGRPAEPKMVAVGAEIGLDLTPHVCQPMSDELAEWADRIYVMEIAHHAHLEEFHPASRGKIELLGTYDDVREIDDPIGAWTKWTFRRTRKQLERCVKRSLDKLPLEVCE